MKQAEPCPRAAAVERSVQEAVSEEEMAELAAHLAECPSCRRLAMDGEQNDALAGELFASLQIQTPVDISVSMARLNELLHDHEVIREIGRGGMGIVYEARQIELDRTVALKVLPLMYGMARPDAVSRFRREAALAAKLKHSSIIAIYDFGQIEGTLYYAMELIQGRSLREILREIEDTGTVDAALGEAVGEPNSTDGDNLTKVATRPRRRRRNESRPRLDRRYFRKVAEWIAQVAEALDYAHGCSVIHRDIKPSNLLVTPDGRIMIADFGLACPTNGGTDTMTQSVMGTCRYMSPEQVDRSRGPIDHRVDVYALGATMYELLTIRSMLPAVDDGRVLVQVLNQDPPSPRSIVPEVPPELETICLKATAKCREARYETAKAFADDLKRWLLNLPILARRPSLTRRAVKFVQRRKLPVAAVATIVALVFASGLLYDGYRSWQDRAVEERIDAWSERVQHHLYDAFADFNNGRVTPALSKIDATMAAYPGEVEVQLARASMLHELGRGDEAAEYLSSILSKRPDRWPAHLLLARIYKELGRPQPAADGHEKLARQRMTHQDATTHYLQALCQDNAEAALGLLNQSIELDRTNVGALLSRCQRLFELKRYDAMLIDAERAVALRPRWSVAHGQMGRALRWLGRGEEAIYALNRAIELDPQCPLWWANRSGARIYLRRWPQALADADEAIKLDPFFAEAYALRGFSRAALGDVAKSMRDFERAIQIRPSDALAYIGRGVVFCWLGKWNGALTDFEKAEELDPGHVCICDYSRACVRDHRGRCHLGQGDYETALSEFTRSIELPSPEWIDSRGARGIVFFRLFRFEEAVSDFTHVLEKNPTSSVLLLRRALSYEMIGKDRLALRDYDRILERSKPNSSQRAYALLAKFFLLRRTGQDDTARNVLDSRASPGAGRVERLLDFVSGSISSEQLLAAAASEDERCGAYYYVGMMALVENEISEASNAFSECVALDRPNILECEFARARLDRLEHRPATDRSIQVAK